MAARISSKAYGGEILVSSLVKKLTEAYDEIQFGEGMEVVLKGLSGVTRLHQVEWNQALPAAPPPDYRNESTHS